MGIYVWGTGCGASELLEQGLALDRICAFVDSFPCGDTFLGRPAIPPSQLRLEETDLLIITTRHADAVARTCNELGIPGENCLYLKNYCELWDRNRNCRAGEILGEDLLRKLLPKQHIVPTPAQLADAVLPERELQNDYVRLATLELICRRLEKRPRCRSGTGCLPRILCPVYQSVITGAGTVPF